jgi:RNA polymerase sigma-70 factor (ECF subfamily)
MGEYLDISFIRNINQNLGIAHKIARLYFELPEEREDAIQEMMYHLWQSYPGFDGRSKFSTWMYRVCLNTALTYRRRSGKNKLQNISPDHYQIPDNTFETKDEEIALLLEAIAKLSELNKAIVLLYLDNLSYDEIASILGISRTNVSVRLVRIRKELETELRSKI